MPGKRMTFKQRAKIQVYLEDPRNRSLSRLSKIIGLKRNTIYYEIIKRRISKGSRSIKFLNRKPVLCELLKSFPFCCNSCFRKQNCSKEIFIYDAYSAHESFEHTKRTCAKKPQLNEMEMKKLDELVSPRILSGQSIYHVVNSDDDINLSEHTVRRYIQKGYLTAKVIDLPRTVQRRNMDYVVEKRTHIDVKLLNGRMFDDYQLYLKQYPTANVLEMDTLIGKRNDKKCILTLYERKSKLQVGILIDKNSTAVNNALMTLIKALEEVNAKFFDVIVTDNGFEFKDLSKIEINEDGEYRFKLFYCDPYASYQKGGCERNHEFFRYIKRKGISFDSLTQFELDNIFSNINSYKRKSLNGNTPYQVFKEHFGLNVLEILHIHYVEPLKVILKQ